MLIEFSEEFFQHFVNLLPELMNSLSLRLSGSPVDADVDFQCMADAMRNTLAGRSKLSRRQSGVLKSAILTAGSSTFS